MRTTSKIILSASVLGILVWVAESFADYYAFGAKGNVWNSLVFLSPRELVTRAFVLAAFITFGIVMAIAIARRTRTEEALSNEVDFMRRILDSTDDHLAVIDADGMIVEVNESWRRFAAENGGDEATCNVGANYYREYSNEWGDTTSSSAAYKGVRQVQKGILSHFKIEYPCNSPKEERWFLMRVLPLVGRQGSVLVYHTNITDRKLAEAALRESEGRFHGFFENQAAGTAITSPSKGWMEANDKLCQMLGYSREELSEMTWLQLTHPDDVAPDLEQFNRLVSDEIDGYVLDKRFIRKDGTIIPVLLSVACIREEDRSLKYILAILLDITKRKVAEDALKDSERNFRQLVEQSPISIAVNSERGDIDYLNQQFIDTFGYTLEDIPTVEDWWKLAYPDERYRQEMLAAWRSSARASLGEGRSIRPREYQVTCKDGTVRTAEIFAGTIGDKIVVILNDVTERKHLEEDKRQFYRDTIKSVTQGKLDLASREEIEAYLDSAELAMNVVFPYDAAIARLKIAEFCASKGLGKTRLASFIIAVGEAITNAIKHANEGCVYAGESGNSIWVAVADKGSGISALTLPGATLRRGFSTKISMGMGYSIMMEESDAIMLCTGPEGTTVILSASIVKPEHDLCLEDFPDTWKTSHAAW